MNVAYELDKLHEWKDHLELLEDTKSKHPFILWQFIYDWKHKIFVKEEEIADFLKITKQ